MKPAREKSKDKIEGTVPEEAPAGIKFTVTEETVSVPIEEKPVEVPVKNTAEVEETKEEISPPVVKEGKMDTVEAIDSIFSNGGVTSSKDEKPIEVLSGKPKSGKKSGKIFLTFLGGLVLGALIGVVLFYLILKPENVKLSLKNEPTPTPTEVLTPSPTAAPEVKLSEYKLQVLNGSGVSGVAAKIKKEMEDLGFTGVAVGNAGKSNYKDTEIQLKSGTPKAVYDKIAGTLTEYTATEGATLQETAKYDIVIIVGAKK